MASFVAPQLADWGCWDAAPEYAAILKSNAAMDPASQFAIVNYLKRAAEAGMPVPWPGKANQILRLRFAYDAGAFALCIDLEFAVPSMTNRADPKARFRPPTATTTASIHNGGFTSICDVASR